MCVCVCVCVSSLAPRTKLSACTARLRAGVVFARLRPLEATGELQRAATPHLWGVLVCVFDLRANTVHSPFPRTCVLQAMVALQATLVLTCADRDPSQNVQIGGLLQRPCTPGGLASLSNLASYVCVCVCVCVYRPTYARFPDCRRVHRCAVLHCTLRPLHVCAYKLGFILLANSCVHAWCGATELQKGHVCAH